MATNTFPPQREAELIPWSLNVKTRFLADYADYSLTLVQATAYGTKHDAFVAQYNICQNPLTRSPENISVKDALKRDLVDEIHLLCGIVQRAPGTTNPMRVGLGLPELGLGPTPIGRPAFAPLVRVKSVNGRLVTLELRDAEHPDRRAKPAGVHGATILSHVGTSVPDDVSGFKFEGNTGKTTVEVLFPTSVSDTAQVFITAFWFSPSMASGPAAVAVTAFLNKGGTLPTAKKPSA